MADNKSGIEEEENDTVDYREGSDQEGGIFRWMSVCVVLLAIAGFFSLAWYAYKSGGEVTSESDAEIILADASPVKEAPVNPGGIVIPNQDKAVYGLVGEGKQEEGKGVEHILSSPETPIIHNEESEVGTWMSDEVKEKLKAGEGASEDKKIGISEEAEKTTEKSPAKPEEKATQPLEIKDLKLAEKPTEATSPKDTMTESKPEGASVDDSQPKTEKKAVEEKPKEAVIPKEPVKKETAVPTGGVRVRAQLGAFKSEAEAAGVWKKIEKKFSSEVSAKSHTIVRADLGAKGVFYRLQLSPFEGMKDAERFCLSLVSEGQGCMPIKGK